MREPCTISSKNAANRVFARRRKPLHPVFIGARFENRAVRSRAHTARRSNRDRESPLRAAKLYPSPRQRVRSENRLAVERKHRGLLERRRKISAMRREPHDDRSTRSRLSGTCASATGSARPGRQRTHERHADRFFWSPDAAKRRQSAIAASGRPPGFRAARSLLSSMAAAISPSLITAPAASPSTPPIPRMFINLLPRFSILAQVSRKSYGPVENQAPGVLSGSAQK